MFEGAGGRGKKKQQFCKPFDAGRRVFSTIIRKWREECGVGEYFSGRGGNHVREYQVVDLDLSGKGTQRENRTGLGRELKHALPDRGDHKYAADSVGMRTSQPQIFGHCGLRMAALGMLTGVYTHGNPGRDGTWRTGSMIVKG